MAVCALRHLRWPLYSFAVPCTARRSPPGRRQGPARGGLRRLRSRPISSAWAPAPVPVRRFTPGQNPTRGRNPQITRRRRNSGMAQRRPPGGNGTVRNAVGWGCRGSERRGRGRGVGGACGGRVGRRGGRGAGGGVLRGGGGRERAGMRRGCLAAQHVVPVLARLFGVEGVGPLLHTQRRGPCGSRQS